MILLEAKNVFYTYPQAKEPALNGVSLRIEEGEYIAVLGTNGSGKSTLARLFAGFMEADSGELEFRDDLLTGIVFQQPKEQIVAGIVGRDTAFGPQNLNMTESEIELRTIECLAMTGLEDRALDSTTALSLGQTQKLALSGILALYPELLLLDEAAAMLDPASRTEFIKLIEVWNKKGHTVIHVTHDFTEALAAKRIIVLEKGKIIFDSSREDFMKNSETAFKIFGGEIKKKRDFLSYEELSKTEDALVAEDISFSYPERQVFKNLSFKLKKGTLTAITGPSGCGKSTLFECLAGLKTGMTGKIFAKERPVLALQETEASLFAAYAADDVAFGAKNKGIKGKALLNTVKLSMEKAGLSYAEFGDKRTFSLSGGEKRKLSIAGILALNSPVMIFDEPTAGLDSASKAVVLETLQNLAQEGKTVLFSTHRMEEACIADVQLDWETLCNTSPGEDSSLKEELPLQKPLANAAMLESLSKAARALTAPAKIPLSFISKLSPFAKVLVFMALAIFTMAATTVPLCLLALALCALYSVLAKYPLKKAVSSVFKLLPWFILFALIQFVFYNDLSDSVILLKRGYLVVTKAKLFTLLKTFIRSPAIILLLGTFIYSTQEREILDGISVFLSPLAKLKIPVRYAVIVIGIIFRFIPLLVDEMAAILKTQMMRGTFAKAKGLGKLKILVPLFVPIILQSFRKAQSLSDALSARYFS